MFEKNIVTATSKESFPQICKAVRLIPKVMDGVDVKALKSKLEIPDGATADEIQTVTINTGYLGLLNIFEVICEKNSDSLFEFLSVCFFSTKEEVENASTISLIAPIFQLINSPEIVGFFI